MNYKDVKAYIEEGEGFTVEFKRRISSPEKIARTLIAFANTKGGTMLFGIDDNGTIIGVESEKSELELIRIAGTDFCDPIIEPRIDIVPVMGKDVILCFVEESSTKPHFFLGESSRTDHANGDDGENTRVFIRVNDTTVAASKEVVRILQNENQDAPPLTLSIGDNERRLFAYLEEHQRITTQGFGKLVNVSDRRASRMLVRLIRAGVIRIHTHEKQDFFTLAHDISGIPTLPPRAVRGVAR